MTRVSTSSLRGDGLENFRCIICRRTHGLDRHWVDEGPGRGAVPRLVCRRVGVYPDGLPRSPGVRGRNEPVPRLGHCRLLVCYHRSQHLARNHPWEVARFQVTRPGAESRHGFVIVSASSSALPNDPR